MNWTLFVEGTYDRALVEWLLWRLEVDNVHVAVIEGGVSKLKRVANEIHKSRDEGRRIALLLDADSDVQHRRNALKDEIERLDLPIERTFLLPDNEGEGTLETLLEQMAPSTHQGVYACLDEYKACLSTLNKAYTTPGPKARVYAYCEAIGAKTGPGKDYDDTTHWNPDTSALEPLRQFLKSMSG